MPKVSVRIVDDGVALEFWRGSPHATVFTHPEVLGAMAHGHEWFLASKGAAPVCLWPVPLDSTGRVRTPEFSYYVGPMWSAEAAARPAHRALSDALEVYEALIEALVGRYGEVHAELPVGLDDVRAFDWWNYHVPDRPRFSLSPRYTARIPNLQNSTDEDLKASFRELRRRELRRVEKGAVPKRIDAADAEVVRALYHEVMHRQDRPVSAETDNAIAQVHSLASTGHGLVVGHRNDGAERPASLVVLLIGNATGNMVLNLTATDARTSGIQARTVVEAMRAARVAGCDVFDFNGANSPRRGDDKHSYGAGPALYFRLDYSERG
jgi:hypothetical protein